MGQSKTLADLLSKTVGPGNSDTTELKAGYSTLPDNRYSDFKNWYSNLKENPSHEDDYGDFRDILDSQFGLWSNRAYSSDQFNPQNVVNWAANQGVKTDTNDVLKMFKTVGLIPDNVKADDTFNENLLTKNNNQNNMTATYYDPLDRDLTDNQKRLDQIYRDNLGRSASFGTKGGADYWLDTHAQGDTVDWDNISRMIGGSDEATKFAASKTTNTPSGIARVGGIDPTKSISSQAGEGTWASHFAPGGKFANENAAGAATAIAKDINFGPPKPVGQEDGVNITPDYFNTGVTDQTGADNTGTTIPPAVSDGWWTEFADKDAFKEFLQGDQTQTQSGGMDDFMKFMMLMSVMGGGRGGGGYGGSQYGYGGLNPGGVQAAYNPLQNLQGFADVFKNLPGIGGGTTLNATGTA